MILIICDNYFRQDLLTTVMMPVEYLSVKFPWEELMPCFLRFHL